MNYFTITFKLNFSLMEKNSTIFETLKTINFNKFNIKKNE